MSSYFVLVVNTNNDAATTASEIAPNVASNSHTSGADAWNAINNIAAFMQTQVLGRGINVVVSTGAVAASGTGTFTGAPVAAQTMTVAGVTITARASGAVENEYNIGADVTETAANLAEAINDSSDLSGIVTATSALGVVTITAAVPGTIGNVVPTVDVNTDNFTFAQSVLAGGVESNRTTLSAGL